MCLLDLYIYTNKYPHVKQLVEQVKGGVSNLPSRQSCFVGDYGGDGDDVDYDNDE